jgi:hypothetical protein
MVRAAAPGRGGRGGGMPNRGGRGIATGPRGRGRGADTGLGAVHVALAPVAPAVVEVGWRWVALNLPCNAYDALVTICVFRVGRVHGYCGRG